MWEDHDHNEAGKIFEAQSDRLLHLRDRCADLIREASPDDEFERMRRLEVLIRHELDCNGNLRSAPELRASINKRRARPATRSRKA